MFSSYRKIPGDHCEGGITPERKEIDLILMRILQHYLQYLSNGFFLMSLIGFWCTGTLYYSSTLKLTVSKAWMTWTHWRVARHTTVMIQMRYILPLTGPPRVTDTWIIIRLF
ncbi:hypothetical protein cypCar_00007502 [Cyprinus carpio]|nr:hypothetical protein cypCar_00007502 [Cyprinus carpio]